MGIVSARRASGWAEPTPGSRVGANDAERRPSAVCRRGVGPARACTFSDVITTGKRFGLRTRTTSPRSPISLPVHGMGRQGQRIGPTTLLQFRHWAARLTVSGIQWGSPSPAWAERRDSGSDLNQRGRHPGLGETSPCYLGLSSGAPATSGNPAATSFSRRGTRRSASS